MKHSLKAIRFLIFILFVSLSLINCGAGGSSATTSGTSSTPPVDIPTPVSHLSISTPNSNGISTVTAEAGFADGGTTVTLTNTSVTSTSLLDHLIAQAWAQVGDSIATVVANTDGSFQTTIAASAGDIISVVYTLDGTSTTATTAVPQTLVTVSMTATLQDVAVDAISGDMLLVANDGTDGFVMILNPTTLVVSNTILLENASGANRIAVDPTTGDALVIDNTNSAAWNVDVSALSATEVSVFDPLDVAFLESGQFALITHGSSIVVSYFNTTTNNPDSSGTATGDDFTTALSAEHVDTDHNGVDDVFALVTTMDNDAIHVICFSVFTGGILSQSSDSILTGVTEVGGLAFFSDGLEVLVTDTANDQVLRVNTTTDAIENIAVGSGPLGVYVNDVDNKAYVVNATDRTLSTIDLSDNSVTTTDMVLGLSPTRIGLDRTMTESDILIVNTGDGSANIL